MDRILNSAELVEVGGVMLTPESIEAATSKPKMTGSMLIVQAENIDVVKKLIETDIYYTTGVVSLFLFIRGYERIVNSDQCQLEQWDPERLVISPIILATPLP